MSTAYGLKCLTCDQSILRDSLRTPAMAYDALNSAPSLVKLLHQIRSIPTSLGVDVEISAWWCENLNDFIDWLADHHEHQLCVVDEYGRES